MELSKPKMWPGSESGSCEARLLYCDEFLWVSYKLSGSFTEPVTVPPPDVAWCKETSMPEDYWPILDDDRVEIFLWPHSSDKAPNDEEGGHYYAIECNKGGKAIQGKVGFRKQFDWTWKAEHRAELIGESTIVLRVPWASYGVDLSKDPSPSLRMAICRGEKSAPDEGVTKSGIWSNWVDPCDDTVDFHRSEHFGRLELC
jgi:hypothetical protein